MTRPMKLRRLLLLARGPLAAALLFVLAALVVLATLLFQYGIGTAQGPVELGTDTDPDGNTATSLGARDACVSVHTDDTFEFDIVVSDVHELVAWELYLRFDPSIVEVVDADMDDTFLDSNPGSSLIKKSEFYVGRHFLGAADRRLLGASGSGILARVTLHAKAPGTSNAEIFYFDFDGDGGDDFGPRLTDSEGTALGDVTGDRVFDGPTYHARIAVDESCDAAPPTPTLPPSPTPPPGGGTAPPHTPPPDVLPVPGDPTFEPPSDASAADGASASENSEDSAPDGASGASPDDEDAAAPGAGGSGEADAGNKTPVPGSDPDQGPGEDSLPSSSSSGGGLPLWAIGSIAVAVLVTAAGTSVYMAARREGRFGR